MIEKRKNPQMTESEMYEVSEIKKEIKRERRKDQLDKLNEVRQQKRVWRNVVVSSIILNLILMAFAIIGYLNNA